MLKVELEQENQFLVETIKGKIKFNIELNMNCFLILLIKFVYLNQFEFLRYLYEQLNLPSIIPYYLESMQEGSVIIQE